MYRRLPVTHACNADSIRPCPIATPAEAASLTRGTEWGRANIRRQLTSLQRTLASAFAVGLAAATLFLLGTKADTGPSPSHPIFKWFDDLQIWRTFPTAMPDDPWHDPPYAPH